MVKSLKSRVSVKLRDFKNPSDWWFEFMIETQPSFDLPTLAAARPFEIARVDKHDVRASSFGAVDP